MSTAEQAKKFGILNYVPDSDEEGSDVKSSSKSKSKKKEKKSSRSSDGDADLAKAKARRDAAARRAQSAMESVELFREGALKGSAPPKPKASTKKTVSVTVTAAAVAAAPIPPPISHRRTASSSSSSSASSSKKPSSGGGDDNGADRVYRDLAAVASGDHGVLHTARPQRLAVTDSVLTRSGHGRDAHAAELMRFFERPLCTVHHEARAPRLASISTVLRGKGAPALPEIENAFAPGGERRTSVRTDALEQQGDALLSKVTRGLSGDVDLLASLPLLPPPTGRVLSVSQPPEPVEYVRAHEPAAPASLLFQALSLDIGRNFECLFVSATLFRVGVPTSTKGDTDHSAFVSLFTMGGGGAASAGNDDVSGGPTAQTGVHTQLSETLHVELGKLDIIANLARFTGGGFDPETRARSGLFPLMKPGPDVVLLLRLFKVARDDETAGADLYMKPVSDKVLAKLQEDADIRTRRLGAYLQTFGYAVIPLFDDSGNFLPDAGDSKGQQTVPFRRVRVDDSCDAVLLDAWRRRAGAPIPTSEQLPGGIKVQLNLLRKAKQVNNLKGRLDLHLMPVAPFPGVEDLWDGERLRALPAFGMVREMAAIDSPSLVLPRLTYQSVLYVKFEAANFAKYSGSGSARNISVTVELRASARGVGSGSGDASIFGRAPSRKLVSRISSPLTYHQTKPTFSYEVKVLLPPFLDESAHLFFVFEHVSCKLKKGDEGTPTSYLGFACLPIARKGVLVPDRSHHMPVAVDTPGKSYFSHYVSESSELKWLDNRKPAFTVTTSSLSSAHSTDRHVGAFFKAHHLATELLGVDYGSKIDLLKSGGSTSLAVPAATAGTSKGRHSSSHEATIDTDSERYLRSVCTNLRRASHASTSRHCFVLAERLLMYIQQAKVLGGAVATESFKSLMHVAAVSYRSHGSTTQLSMYSSSLFDPAALLKGVQSSADPFHETLLSQWAALLASRAPEDVKLRRAAAGVNSFIADLIVKCTHIHMASSSRATLSDSFFASLKTVFNALASESNELEVEGVTRLAEYYMLPVGTIVSDVLVVGTPEDKDATLKLLSSFCKSVDSSGTREKLTCAKWELVRMLGHHEHFLAFCEPRHVTSFSVRSWSKRHFLPTIIAKEASSALKHESPAVRSAAGQVVREILAINAVDPKVVGAKDPAAARTRVADILFILVPYMCDSSSYFANPALLASREAAHDWFVSFAWLLSQASQHLVVSWMCDESRRRRAAIFWLLREGMASFSHDGDLAAVREELATVTLRLAVSAVTAVTASSTRRRLSDDEPTSALIAAVCEAIAGDRVSHHLAVSVLTFLRYFAWTQKTVLFSSSSSTSFVGLISFQVLRWCNCADSSVRSRAASLWLLLMYLNHRHSKGFARVKLQSTIAVSSLTSAQSDEEFDVTRLKGVLESVGKAALDGKAFALTTKTSMGHGGRHEGSSASVSKSTDGDDMFGAEVSELMERLFSVLKYSAKLARFRYDPEMTADLYIQLSLNYVDSPVLRVTWLRNLSAYHLSRGNMVEAACASIMVGALVHEYLTGKMFAKLRRKAIEKSDAAGGTGTPTVTVVRTPRHSDAVDDEGAGRPISSFSMERSVMSVLNGSDASDLVDGVRGPSTLATGLEPVGLIKGTDVFGQICSHIATAPGLPKTDDPGAYDSPVFSVEGLVAVLSDAFSLLRKAHHFELAAVVYNVVATHRLALGDFRSLRRDFRKLAEMAACVVTAEESQSRLGGNYYRVGFYSKVFEEFHRREFIYKAPSELLIADFCEMLQAQFSRALNGTKLQLLRGAEDGAALAKASPDTAFLQITAVKPTSTSSAVDHFSAGSFISTFTLDTPFTKAGGTYGDASEQWTRRVTFTTTDGFPYLTTRSLVRDKSVREITPIEGALESIQGRADTLLEEAAHDPPDPKTLQRVLQGSVLLQVNAGPLAIAKCFLSRDAIKRYSSKQDLPVRAALEDAFVDFLRGARACLRVNEQLIEADQEQFQQQLEAGYNSVRDALAEFINESRLPQLQ